MTLFDSVRFTVHSIDIFFGFSLEISYDRKMLSSRHLKGGLKPHTLITPLRSIYNWGNYDASSGECCKMRDCKATASRCKTLPCGKITPIPNQCYQLKAKSFDYSKYIREIYERNHCCPKCEIINHDKFYRPSDKRRRYQRTWPECPLLSLRPKETCCYDREYCPPMKRRKPPPRCNTKLTLPSAIDHHLHRMAMLCKEYLTMPCCGPARRPPRCRTMPVPSNCKKKNAPFPSFSECDHDHITRVCPTECACKIRPSTCELWEDYHRTGGVLKRCAEDLDSYCPFKHRYRKGPHPKMATSIH